MQKIINILAVITENGIWIKDEVEENINIINANTFKNKILYDVDILQFDKNFNFVKQYHLKKY